MAIHRTNWQKQYVPTDLATEFAIHDTPFQRPVIPSTIISNRLHLGWRDVVLVGLPLQLNNFFISRRPSSLFSSATSMRNSEERCGLFPLWNRLSAASRQLFAPTPSSAILISLELEANFSPRPILLSYSSYLPSPAINFIGEKMNCDVPAERTNFFNPLVRRIDLSLTGCSARNRSWRGS